MGVGVPVKVGVGCVAVTVGVSVGMEVTEAVVRGAEVGLIGMKDSRSENEQANAKSPNNAIQPVLFISASYNPSQPPRGYFTSFEILIPI